MGVLRLRGQSSAPPPCRASLPQILVRGRDSESNGILDFLKPLPSESEEKISADRSVETLKPRKGSDWLLETGYAMGVRTGTRHEYPGRKARHSLRDEKVKLQRDGEPLPLLDTCLPIPQTSPSGLRSQSPCLGTWDFALTLLLLPGGPCYTVSPSPGPGAG